jgi:hypothetical protein
MNTQQSTLLATHCIDANVLFNFWKLGPDEPYGKDVFKTQWDIIEKRIEAGTIVAPKAVYDEIMKGKIPDDPLKQWAKDHSYMFIELDDDQVAAMAPIVTKYDVYNDMQRGSYADLCVIVLAKSRNLTVLTSERTALNISMKNPKIPNVCQDQDVSCTTLVEMFRSEGVSF